MPFKLTDAISKGELLENGRVNKQIMSVDKTRKNRTKTIDHFPNPLICYKIGISISFKSSLIDMFWFSPWKCFGSEVSDNILLYACMSTR